MKTKYVAIGLTVTAILAIASFDYSANALGGLKMHSFHFGKHFRPMRHHKNFNQWPFYGGYGGLYAIPPYDSYNSGIVTDPMTIVLVAPPPRALTCEKSKEIRTVPSESGGTRDITITRC